ncbi:MAG: sulfatase-like hydrolase/transferase [Planctomycetota bacterium]
MNRNNVIRFLSAAALVAAAGFYVLPKFISSPTKRPDIILVSIDTCRADFIGCYNPAAAEATPNIDAVARQATIFRRATTPVPITLPAHSSMMTGLTPLSHGVRNQLETALSPDAVTLAKLLSQRGYQTAAVVGSHALEGSLGLAQGFDTYDDHFRQSYSRGWSIERKAEEATAIAIERIDQSSPDQPLFMFLHYYDPHLPYEAPERFASRFGDDLPGQYAAEIAYVDECLGAVFEVLKQRGRFDDALIIITADHGELHGEHGELGHQYFIYDGALHVPLLVKLPGQTESRDVLEPVGLVDLMPTICELLDIEPPECDGRSLAEVLTGEGAVDGQRYLYCESTVPRNYGANPLFGLTGGPWKYIHTTDSELYDLTADPAEMTNRLSDRPEMGRALADQLRRRMLEMRPIAGGLARPRETGDANLSTLGYAGSGPGDAPVVLEDGLPDPKEIVSVHTRFQQAVLHVAESRAIEGIEICRELLAEDPGLTRARILLAIETAKLGRLDESIAYYTELIAEDEAKGKWYIARADVYDQAGQPELALGDVDEVIELDGPHPKGLLRRAQLLIQLDREAEAIGELERALAGPMPDDDTAAEIRTLLAELRREDELPAEP